MNLNKVSIKRYFAVVIAVVLMISMVSSFATAEESDDIATPAVIIYGDVNADGNVDQVDCLLILDHYVGKAVEINETAADVYVDGSIDLIDAMLVLDYWAKKPVTLGPVEKTFTVTFKDFDGTVLSTQTVGEGSDAVAPDEPTSSGYKFTGWDGDFTAVSGDIVITAQYAEITEAAIMVNSVKTNPGDNTVDVEISIVNNPGIASLMISAAYDDVLTLENHTFNPEFGSNVTAAKPYTNPENFSFVDFSKNIDVDGAFVTLTFSISEDAPAGTVAKIALTCNEKNTFDVDFNAVSFEVYDGTVTIG